MFSSIAGRLARAGLCSVVLQDGWPRLACVQQSAGRLARAGLCSVVLQDGWPRLACVQ